MTNFDDMPACHESYTDDLAGVTAYMADELYTVTRAVKDPYCLGVWKVWCEESGDDHHIVYLAGHGDNHFNDFETIESL